MKLNLCFIVGRGHYAFVALIISDFNYTVSCVQQDTFAIFFVCRSDENSFVVTLEEMKQASFAE